MKNQCRKAEAKIWEGHVRQFQREGNRIKSEYCREHGLRYHKFLYWYGKYGESREDEISGEWISLKAPSVEEGHHCELVFKSGSCLRLHSLEALVFLPRLVITLS